MIEWHVLEVEYPKGGAVDSIAVHWECKDSAVGGGIPRKYGVELIDLTPAITAAEAAAFTDAELVAKIKTFLGAAQVSAIEADVTHQKDYLTSPDMLISIPT